MKVTKSQLKQFINEELQTLLREQTLINPTFPLRSWVPLGPTAEEEYESLELEDHLSAWIQALRKKGSRYGHGQGGDDTYPHLFDIDYAQNPESPTGYIVDLLLAPDYYYTHCDDCEWQDIFYRYNSVKEAEAAIKLYNPDEIPEGTSYWDWVNANFGDANAYAQKEIPPPVDESPPTARKSPSVPSRASIRDQPGALEEIIREELYRVISK